MSLRVSCLCGESRVGLEVPNPCQTIIEIGRAREGMLKPFLRGGYTASPLALTMV